MWRSGALRANLRYTKKSRKYIFAVQAKIYLQLKSFWKRERERKNLGSKRFSSRKLFFALHRQQRELGGGFGKEVVQRGGCGDGGSAAVDAEGFCR